MKVSRNSREYLPSFFGLVMLSLCLGQVESSMWLWLQQKGAPLVKGVQWRLVQVLRILQIAIFSVDFCDNGWIILLCTGLDSDLGI